MNGCDKLYFGERHSRRHRRSQTTRAPLTEEDRRAVGASREYFRRNPEGGVCLEKVVADLGFTMDQIRGNQGE
jgi:hypothetical protein